MKKYFFEAVNPLAPPPNTRAAVANRVPINSVTQRPDGNYNINMKYQGKQTSVVVDPNKVLKQNQRNMVFRNQYGIQVSPSEVVKALKPKE